MGASLLSGSGSISSAYLGYLLAFVAATAACLGAAWRARSAVPDPETRQALTWFFAGSAAWAGAYVGFLLVGPALWKHLFYQGSLIVGFSVVFAWLWFCSAYSGRGLHRSRRVQQFAAAVFAVVTALKVTNPLHGLYYGLEPAGGMPTGGAFGLVVTHETLYWVVMAVAYALSAAGYLMLLEVFLKAGAQTGPLALLTGLTALPAALNVVGHVQPALLDITHEPLGVAVFAVGLLFAYETQFSVVQLTGSVGEPHLTIGKEGRIRGLGGGIEEIIPALGGKPLGEEALGERTLGRPLEEVLPGLAKTIEEGEAVWRASFDGGRVEECQDSEPASSTQPKEGSRMAEEAGRAGGNTQPREDAQPREDVQPVGHLSSEEVSRVEEVSRMEEVSGVEDASSVEDASGMEDASYLGTGARSEEDCRYFQVVEVGAQAHGETRTVVLSDITERKRRTEQLKEAKKQAELSKLEAEEASRMKSAMLANMSHEIRTPLTGVIGFAEAIGEETRGEETEGNETGEEDTEEEDTGGKDVEGEDTGGKDAEGEGKIARFASLIEDSGRRLLDTLDAVLNLSKLEAGKMSLQPGPVDLSGQARQVAREFEEEAWESGLTLGVETEATWARADEGGLKIVLQNLLSNAIKYTEEGGVTVRVYREDEQSNGNPQEDGRAAAAILEVEDSGIGMDPEVAGRLFEPFRQASEGMSREYEGTGIGLAVTKKATEEMGGSIEVDTQKGEGSRFTVRFPAARSAGSAGGPPAGELQQANQRDLDKPASPR